MLVHVTCKLNVILGLVPIQIDKGDSWNFEVLDIFGQVILCDSFLEFYIVYVVFVLILPDDLLLLIRRINAQQHWMNQVGQHFDIWLGIQNCGFFLRAHGGDCLCKV